MKINNTHSLIKRRSFGLGSLAAGCALWSLAVTPALAVLSTWSGAGTSNYWSVAANWGGTAVATGNALLFSGTTKQVNTNDLVGLTISAVTNTTAGWNITGNAVTDTNGIFVANVTGSSTWGLDTALSTSATFSQSALADILNLTGVLSGTGGIVKSAGSAGQGAVNLANTNNSFTGQINIRSGTVAFASMAPVGQNSALGAGSGAILVGYTGTGYGANLVFNGTTNCMTDHAINFANANTGNITVSNNSPNNSSLTFTYPGSFTFSDNTANTYFAFTLAGTSAGTNTFFPQFGSALWGGNLQISGPGTFAFSNVFNFTGNLNVSGSSHVALLYNANYPATEIPGFAQITLNSGATLDVSTYDQNSSTFVLGNVGGYPQVLVAGRTNGAATDINGSLSLAGAGGATLKVAGANVAGTLTISTNFIPASGTITMDLSTNTTVGQGTNDLILVGGNLDLSQGTTIISTTALKGSVNTNAPYTLIAYSGSLIGSASGLSVLAPSRAYLPGVVSTANAGLIQVTFAPSGQTNASLIWQGNYSQNWDVDVTANWLNGANNDYFFGGDNVVFNDSSSQTAVNLVGALSPASITVSNTVNDYTFSTTSSGLISGGTLTKQGTAALTLSTANTFAGGTVISAGTITAASSSALGSGPVTLGDAHTGANTPTLVAGAILPNAINAVSNATVATATGGTLNGAITLQGDATLANNSGLAGVTASDALAIQGGIVGTGNLTATGGGFIKLQTGACTFAGNINITGAGTMLDINTAMNTNVNINVGAGAYLGDVNSPQINSLTGSGLVAPGPGLGGNCTLYFGTAGGSGTFAGSFTNNSGGYSCNLVKLGAGTITFTGDNSLSGGITVVSNGTLVVANAIGYGLGTGSFNIYSNATAILDNSGGYASGNGVVTVNTGGTLCGAGSIYSATHTLQVSGVFAVGNPGHAAATTFTVTNSGIFFNDGGVLTVSLFSGAGAGDNSANAAAADVLNAQSAVSISTNTTLNVLNPKGLTAWAIGDKWKIANWQSTPTNQFATLNLPALSGGLAWDTTQLYSSGVIAVVVGAPTASAQILNVTFAGGSLTLNGTNNNVPNTSFHYAVLATTNLTLPLANWTALTTNAFNANGTFNYSHPVDPTQPAMFFNVKAVP